RSTTARGACLLLDEPAQKHQRVLGLLFRAIRYLMSARKTGGDNRALRVFAHRRKENPVSDCLTDVVMLVAERTRHAAASGIDFPESEARNKPQRTFRPPCAQERFLLAMAVQERA